MSDGRKAAYEAEEMDYYNQRLKFYAAKSPEQIYKLMHILDESMHYFIKHDPALTSSQWCRIDNMREAIKIFNSKQ